MTSFIEQIIRSMTFMFIVFPFMLIGQVSLREYSDSNKRGYKSIVFEKVAGKNSDGSGKNELVEYDIQKNNPYNKLALSVKGVAREGYTIYQAEDIRAINTSLNEENFNDLEVHSHYFLHAAGNHAAIAYNLNPTSEGETIESARRSEVVVLRDGEEIAHLKLDTDAFDVTVSPNGRFVAYQVNEHLAHSSFSGEQGFVIYDIQNKSVFLSEGRSTVSIGNWFDLISVAFSLESNRRGLYLLNTLTGQLYFRDMGTSRYRISILDNNTLKQAGNTFDLNQDFQLIK